MSEGAWGPDGLTNSRGGVKLTSGLGLTILIFALAAWLYVVIIINKAAHSLIHFCVQLFLPTWGGGQRKH